MTATIEAPPEVIDQADAADQGPAPALFVQPDAAAAAPRRAAAPPRPMPADPEAPFGWMVDPRTGEKRPRKTAGRQKTAGRGKATPPPKKRATNAPRVARPAGPDGAPPPMAASSHTTQAGMLLDMLWMTAAGIPTPPPGARALGVDVHAVSIRTKASAAVLAHHKPAVAQSVGTIADHVPMIGRGIEAMSREDGAAWVFPVMFALVPFVGQMAAMWKAPIDQIAGMAAQTDATFRAMVGPAPQAPAAVAPSIPGEVPLPGMPEPVAA